MIRIPTTIKKGRKTRTIETQAELDDASVDGWTVVTGTNPAAPAAAQDPVNYEDLPIENLVEQIKARGLATEFGVEPVLGDLDLEKVDADKLRAGLIADDEKNRANA